MLGFGGRATAQQGGQANNLEELRRELGACLGQTRLAAGSRVAISFAMRRDGTLIGQPRIAYSHLEGDAEARARFLADARRALNSCLPIRITPAFGAAIAGQIFSITLGGEKPQQKI